MSASEVRGRTIELWVEQRDGRPAVNPVMRALLDSLLADGAHISVRVPEQRVATPSTILGDQAPDLILLKTATTLGLSLAVAGERMGGHFLNSAHASMRANDKPAVVARLAAAGLPVPETWMVTSSDSMTAPVATPTGWVSKPARGIHGAGVELHDRFPTAIGAADNAVPTAGWVVDDGVRMVQTRIGRDEADLKVYVAGDRSFAGEKVFGSDSYQQDDISERTLEASVEAIVRAAGEVLGLRCFGVDLRFRDNQPVIIDVNPFPGYRGFPDAAQTLRGEVERALAQSNPAVR